MAERRESNVAIDWLTVSIYLGLVLTGWLMIYAVDYRPGSSEVFDMGSRHGSQMVWVGISLVIGSVIMLIDAKIFKTFALPIYISAMILLIYVLLAGTIVSGSKSWISLGGFRFQPAEVAKFATCLALSSYLGAFNTSLKKLNIRAGALGIIFLPMVLVLFQGDAGSALVFTSLLLVLYREGMPQELYIFGIVIIILSVLALMSDESFSIILGLILVASLVLVNTFRLNRPKLTFILFGAAAVWGYYTFPEYQLYILGVTGVIFLLIVLMRLRSKSRRLAIILTIGVIVSGGYTFVVNYGFYNFLKPHQQDRLLVWLRPDKVDPLGALYNVTWSKRAIGSGGLTGKGFLEGNVTKLNYVPEQATDFIFCAIGEEQGFIGVFAVIMLFLLLLLRIVAIAERQRSRFTRIYAYGVASILFFHLLINIGMTMGIMPVIGIPLPFISYGGSSLISFTILLFILLKLDSNEVMR